MLKQSGLYYPLIKNKPSDEDSFEKKNIFKFNESKIQGKSNNIGKFKKDEKNKRIETMVEDTWNQEVQSRLANTDYERNHNLTRGGNHSEINTKNH